MFPPWVAGLYMYIRKRVSVCVCVCVFRGNTVAEASIVTRKEDFNAVEQP